MRLKITTLRLWDLRSADWVKVVQVKKLLSFLKKKMLVKPSEIETTQEFQVFAFKF